jgi:hypothetical protein
MSPHILALDIAGAPHRWINVRNAAHYYATDMIAWAIGTNEFVLHGGTQRATGLQSIIRASSIIAIKGKDRDSLTSQRVPRLCVDARRAPGPARRQSKRRSCQGGANDADCIPAGDGHEERDPVR